MEPFGALRRIAGIATAVALIGASVPSWAEQARPYAKLTDLQGTVLVDSGTGFIRILDDVGLKLGDRVMVTDGGGARLVFSDNCALPLAAPSMTTVTETACTTATQGTDGTGSGAAGAAIVGLGMLGVGAFIIFTVLDDEESVSP